MAEPSYSGDIAIIGMALEFPGAATNSLGLWDMLLRGEDAWSEFPPDRLNIDGYYHPNGNRQGSLSFKGAHFIRGNVAAFDAPFFNISAAEAKAMDPQQRKVLEITYHAIENAGLSKEQLDGSDTSVTIGAFVRDYEQTILRDPDHSPQYAATGTGTAILSNRISHAFNLHGPSQTIDTGCSGSLVAVHHACQDLRSGRSPIAIAGGVGMILTPATMMPMNSLQFLSPDGRCFTFSEKANGYGRGEGVAVVIMKRLEDAIKDNDTIRAVIRGSRTNQDGRTPGITMPSTQAQVANIKGLYSDFGLDADKTAYVECHGTGTQAGDPKEVSAIHQSFCVGRKRKNPIIVGSIKPNIGHLEGAAGVAGLIKAVLMVERGMIPKNLHFDAPGNPAIKFKEWNIEVPTELRSWPTKGLRRVSVNCFGFGGTNAHVVIDDAAHYLGSRQLQGRHQSYIAADDELLDNKNPTRSFRSAQLFMISSHEQSGVSRIIDSHASYVKDHENDADLMPNYAYTLSRRSSMEFKAFIVASSNSDLLKKMQNHSTLQVINSASPKVALVFCGQGAQWYAMGRELMAYERFAYSLTGASRYLKKILESSFNLHDELMKDEKTSRIHDPEIAQPATTAIQIALVDLLRDSELTPVATIGHSSGEIAAAYAAGYLNHEDAWKIAYERGRHAASLPQYQPGRKGAMMAVGLSAGDVQSYLDIVATGKVVVACHNSPNSATLSGDEDQILELRAILEADGIFARLLSVQVAYHSHHMKEVEDEYRESICDITPTQNDKAPQMFSSVTGEVVTSKDLGPGYWSSNLVSPVRFDEAFAQMYTSCRPDIILEVGPSALLKRAIKENLEVIAPKKATSAPCLSMLSRNQDACITTLSACGEMWARGYPVNLSWSFKSREDIEPRVLSDLPPYPFNHSKQYWHESHLGHTMRFREHGREDLIGAPTDSTLQEPRWRGFFRLSENPWIGDHKVQKTVVYPAAGMLTMALEAARQSVNPALHVIGFEILNFMIRKPIIIPSTEHGLEHSLNTKVLKTTTINTQVCSTVFSFTIYTKALDCPWQENAAGFFKILYGGEGEAIPLLDAPLQYKTRYQEVMAQVEEEIAPRQLYEHLDAIGMNYGPLFRNILAIRKNRNTCTSVIRIPDTKAKMPAKFEYDHVIHPATLDSVFQTIFAIGDESMVPSFIKRIFFSAAMPRGAGEELVGYATAERFGLREARADITMSDASWKAPLIVAEGLEFTSITTSGSSGFIPSYRNLCSEIVWEEYTLPAEIEETGSQSVSPKANSVVIILPDHYHDSSSKECRTVCESIQKLLEQADYTVATTLISNLSEEHARMLCISLVELDQLQDSPFFLNISEREFDALHKLLTSTSGLLWITVGGQMTADNPTSSPFSALARTIRSEDSSKSIYTLDLEVNLPGARDLIADRIVKVFRQTCCQLVASEITDVDFAARGGQLYVPRLEILPELSNVIEAGSSFKKVQTCPISAAGNSLNLEIGTLGDVDSIYFTQDHNPLRPLGPDEICVEINSTRFFPEDLNTVLGKGTNDFIGADIFGKIVNVGANVANCGLVSVKVGDTIMALAHGTMRTHAIIKAEHVIEIMGEEDTMPKCSPSCLVSAYYGLITVGQLAPDDTVLIHAAASAQGQTALNLARSRDARVIAGVTTNEQRDFLLCHCDITEDRIVNISTDLVRSTVRQLTDGQGVDLVFGSTAETETMDYECVKECGHIIQTSPRGGSRTISSLEGTASILNIDLRKLMQQRPKLVQQVMRNVKMAIRETMNYSSISSGHVFDVADLATALRMMQQDPHLADFSISISPDSLVPTAFNPVISPQLDRDATYLLVGGFGGLGRTVAELLVRMGARHLAFFSRSGGTDESSRQFLQHLRDEAINAKAYQVDICDKAQLTATLERVKQEMPEIKGAIQAAAVIKDSMFERMTYDDWMTATLPKINGSWNLHEALPTSIDFMIFLSSAAGVIGNRGQANYAAGNTFQDALARHRSARNLRTVSLDLGPILGAGMVAEDEATLDKLKASGFFCLRLEDFKCLIERAIAGLVLEDCPLPAQIVTGVGTGGLIMQDKPADPYWTRTALFKRLNMVDVLPDSTIEDSSAQSVETIKVALRGATGVEEASRIVCVALVEFLAPALNMESSELDDSKPLNVYGVDSLVATNIRNWVFRNVSVKLTDMEVMGASSVLELSKTIATKGGHADEGNE